MSPVKHRSHVYGRAQQTPDGWAWKYRVACACGAPFEGRDKKYLALEDEAAHLAEVTPPESARCRDPKKHRTKRWDRCPVCADQLVLPGFEEIA